MSTASLPKRIWRRIRKRVRLASYAMSADAFLVSYPKSGRTWFRFILSHYFDNVSGVKAGVDLHSMFAVLPNFDLDAVRGCPAFASGAHFSRVPFIGVSHLPYSRLLYLSRPVIFMVRDPRDVIVSAYFHATRHKHRFEGSISDFIDNEEQGLPALIKYLNGWAVRLDQGKSFVLSYEELTADTAGVTEKVLKFLGRPVDREAVKSAVEAGRFSAMQEREIKEGLPAHDYNRADSESLRMRRGQVGGFGDYLDERQIAAIETSLSRNLSPAARNLVGKTGLSLEQPLRDNRSGR